MKINSGIGTRVGGLILTQKRADDLLGIAFQDASTVSPTAGDYVLYRSGTSLFWFNGTTSIEVGASGSGTVIPSLDGIFAGDKTLNVAGTTLTIDNSTGNNDVLTITNTGAGSGDLIQITNVGTGSDIKGTSGTWSFSKLGAATMLTIVAAGTAGSNSITLTAGDIVASDGSLTITDADDAASFSVTNNTATTASVIALAGSGTFTGSTTTSFMTLTPSGMTTGTAFYLPVAALTTGKAIHVVGNAVTSGILVNITSSAAGTQLTGAGRLFKVDHTGSATGSGVVAEFATAGADETVLLKLTASAALALGTILQVSGSSMTTGSAITASDLDALTTGKGVHVASAATAITTTGRLIYSNHTGTTGTSATLNEFATAATDETVLFALTANDMATGKMLSFGTNIALTTGQLISAAHTTSVIADGGSMLRLSSTGINTGGATNGTMLDVQTTAQVAGTQVLFKAGAVTTGVVLSLISTTGMTSGSLLRATTSTAGAIATNGAISFRATGAFTSTSNVGFVDILASATTAGTVLRVASSAAGQTATELLRVVASGYTTGYTGNVANFIGCSTTGAANVVAITTVNTTDGTGLLVTANSLTTGNAAKFTSSGTVTSSGSGVVNITASGLTTGVGLLVTDGGSSNTLTSGSILKVYSNSNDTTSRGLLYIHNDNTAAIGVAPITVVNDAVTGTGSKFKRVATLAGISLWVSIDGTTPNGALTGDAVGDMCFNASTGKPLICTGTNVWAAVA